MLADIFHIVIFLDCFLYARSLIRLTLWQFIVGSLSTKFRGYSSGGCFSSSSIKTPGRMLLFFHLFGVYYFAMQRLRNLLMQHIEASYEFPLNLRCFTESLCPLSKSKPLERLVHLTTSTFLRVGSAVVVVLGLSNEILYCDAILFHWSV